MKTHTSEEKKYPVVIQKRRILTGREKGKIKECVIWCKFIEDIPEHRKPCIINSEHHGSYEVLSTRVEIRYRPDDIDKTYEEGAH